MDIEIRKGFEIYENIYDSADLWQFLFDKFRVIMYTI